MTLSGRLISSVISYFKINNESSVKKVYLLRYLPKLHQCIYVYLTIFYNKIEQQNDHSLSKVFDKVYNISDLLVKVKITY